jgi:hypothetical protein
LLFKQRQVEQYIVGSCSEPRLAEIERAARPDRRLAAGVMVRATDENIGDLVMGGKKALSLPLDLNRFMIRSRRRASPPGPTPPAEPQLHKSAASQSTAQPIAPSVYL